MCEITNTIMIFFNEGNNSNHHRFKSWEDCYTHFQIKISQNDFEINKIDSLMLGFYLASWGMYRGSSFLLQNSYEIHTPVLQKILTNEYIPLFSVNFNEVTEEWKSLLFKLKQSIVDIYKAETNNSQNVTDTLVTKIILGVHGITPAYDRYFQDGCRTKRVAPFSSFNNESYSRMIKFYLENFNSFNRAKNQIFEITNIEYPPMKLIDMYFWTIGYESNN